VFGQEETIKISDVDAKTTTELKNFVLQKLQLSNESWNCAIEKDGKKFFNGDENIEDMNQFENIYVYPLEINTTFAYNNIFSIQKHVTISFPPDFTIEQVHALLISVLNINVPYTLENFQNANYLFINEFNPSQIVNIQITYNNLDNYYIIKKENDNDFYIAIEKKSIGTIESLRIEISKTLNISIQKIQLIRFQLENDKSIRGFTVILPLSLDCFQVSKVFINSTIGLLIHDVDLELCRTSTQIHVKVDILNPFNSDKYKEIIVRRKGEEINYLFFIYKASYKIDLAKEEINEALRRNENEKYDFRRNFDKTAYKNVQSSKIEDYIWEAERK